MGVRQGGKHVHLGFPKVVLNQLNYPRVESPFPWFCLFPRERIRRMVEVTREMNIVQTD